MHLEEVVRDDRPPRGLSSLAHRVSQPASVRSELENDLVAALCKRRGRSSARVTRRYSSMQIWPLLKGRIGRQEGGIRPRGPERRTESTAADVRTDHARHTSKPPAQTAAVRKHTSASPYRANGLEIKYDAIVAGPAVANRKGVRGEEEALFAAVEQQ